MFFAKLEKMRQQPEDVLPEYLIIPLQDTTSVDQLFGLATTLGTGIYTLVASSAREYAGPSVVLSVLIAAVTSCLGGLCYSEVATRFPRGGSAYAYAYATTGELFAFLIGWSMILEYSLGTALAAKACSEYLDALANGTLTKVLGKPFGRLNIPGLSEYLDFPAVLITVSISIRLAWNIKHLCSINNALVITNVLVICGIVLVGIFNMDAENWTAGAGFFPNGISGVFSAASLCYFAFVGYDVMAISTGEMTHRIRILPTAVSLVFLVGLLAMFTTAASVTLLIPFSLLEYKGSLLRAFSLRGVIGMEYFVSAGAVSGLLSATIASLFSQVRLLQGLAADGLFFRFLARGGDGATGSSKCGCASILTSCIFSSVIGLVCDSSTLVRVLGMGTLLSGMAVAVAVLCLRYGVAERLPLEMGELSRESTVDTLVEGGRNSGDFGAEQNDAQTQTTSIPLCRKDSSQQWHGSGTQDYMCVSPTSINDSATVGARDDPHRNYGSMRLRSLSVDFVNDSFVTCLSELSPHWSKQEPSQKSAATAAGLVAAMMVIMLLMGVMTLHVPKLISGSRWWMELVACALFVAVLVCVYLVCRQPRHRPRLHNRVPCVPLLPLCSIWMDVHLMVGLPYTAWLVFLVWTLLGVVMYLGYGVWNSTEREMVDDNQDVTLLDVADDVDERDQEATQREILVETC